MRAWRDSAVAGERRQMSCLHSRNPAGMDKFPAVSGGLPSLLMASGRIDQILHFFVQHQRDLCDAGIVKLAEE